MRYCCTKVNLSVLHCCNFMVCPFVVDLPCVVTIDPVKSPQKYFQIVLFVVFHFKAGDFGDYSKSAMRLCVC